MTEVTRHEPGTFCWPELGTTDTAEAKKFYTGLFGWAANDVPAGPDMTYTMLQLSGKNIGALYGQQKEQRDQGVPPHWMSYVSVESADGTARKAKELGGKVIGEPFDVFDVGRMAVLQDPTGATFCVWQPKAHIGTQVVNEPGALCWSELATRDTETAGKFYSDLFGWKRNTRNIGGTTYTEFWREDAPVGGMMEMTKEWGEIPPHWMVYFASADADASASKAKNLGGQVKVPPTDIPEVGRFAVLQDPQGAVFSVIKLSERA